MLVGRGGWGRPGGPGAAWEKMAGSGADRRVPLFQQSPGSGLLSQIIQVTDHSTGVYAVPAMGDFKGPRSFHYQDSSFNYPVMRATNC